jgi:RNA 3'-terminal phosphate cyclase
MALPLADVIRMMIERLAYLFEAMMQDIRILIAGITDPSGNTPKVTNSD